MARLKSGLQPEPDTREVNRCAAQRVETASPSTFGGDAVPFSHLDRAKHELMEQREQLQDRLMRVEKALALMGQDSRIRELADLLRDLGV